MTKSPKKTATLRGMTTAVYVVADFEAAKAWYSKLLGLAPYMDTPAYAEFRFGDYQHEFGLLNAKHLGELGGEDSKPTGPAGVILYWAVDDVDATLKRLQDMGAKLHQPPRDFGRGFIGASVIDPFGNILGIMYNPHYFEMLGEVRKAA